MRVAVIGAGVSGLSAAHWLSPRHEVTLFEAEHRLGGHTNTVRVDLSDETHHVDTGFIVYNEENYPLFSGLLKELEIATQPSEMSFSVSSGVVDFEYRGNGLRLWAQPRNALAPSYARFLSDILRFNRQARRLLREGDDEETLAELLARGGYGPRLAEHYLVPLGSAIWSADPGSFSAIPARTLAQFLDNHGMLRLKRRPQWRTVTGGARRYVEAIAASLEGHVRRANPVHEIIRERDGVTVLSPMGRERFDAVVLAVHSDQALGLLGDPTSTEERVLGDLRYEANVATLHTDVAMLPRRRAAWASWNAYLPATDRHRATVTYWMNSLQRLRSSEALCVTLNRSHEIDPATVLGEWEYAHPVLDAAAVRAKARRHELQGRLRTWYCGAYWGYGFHEDGVRSAAEVARALGADIPASIPASPPREELQVA